MDWFAGDTDEAQERLTGAWESAPIEQVELCSMLLDVAREQVLAFAASDEDDDGASPEPPARYVYAQLLQARNLWNAGNVTPGGDLGGDGFSFVPRPLDKTIRSLIRPTTGGADVF